MDRRNFLKKATLAVPGLSVLGVATTQANAPTETVTYVVRAYEGGTRLNFTAKFGKSIAGTAVAYGDDLEETAHILARLLRPNDPAAAKWVIKTWLPKRLLKQPRG